jgi:hypothetical protein
MRGRLAACAAASLRCLQVWLRFRRKGLAFSAPTSILLRTSVFIAPHHYRHDDRHRYGHARGHHGRHYAYGYVFVPSADDYLMPLYAGPVCQKTEETVIVPSESGDERTIRITRC